MKTIIPLFSLLLSFMACEDSRTTGVICSEGYPELHPQESVLRVNYFKQSCTGEMEGTCLLVQQDEQLCTGDWSLFYDEIEGFQYEEGYVYAIKVRIEEVENPPADASALRYILVEVLSKEEKKQ